MEVLAMMFCIWRNEMKFIAAFLTVFLFASHIHAAETPSAFIEGMADKGVGLLTNQTLTDADKTAQFKAILSNYFDARLIGRWVLGRSWRAASDSEKSEYLAVFEEFLIQSYFRKFSRYYSGEILVVKKEVTVSNSNDTVVFTDLVKPNGTVVVGVNWRVRKNGDTMKIIDVMVEGISMGLTQRSEFASVIRSVGVDGLIAKLREMVK